MRSRWLVALLGVSLAANVALVAAMWASWRGTAAASAAIGTTCSAPLCDEEMKVREQLAASLCAPAPDRAAISAALGRLDEVRGRQRAAIVDRWLARCSGARADERTALAATVRKMLCPWQAGSGAACCSPTPAAGAGHAVKPQHGQT